MAKEIARNYAVLLNVSPTSETKRVFWPLINLLKYSRVYKGQNVEYSSFERSYDDREYTDWQVVWIKYTGKLFYKKLLAYYFARKWNVWLLLF